MDHLEMVEKLREKANVTYEEATQALEACDWDLLDALLMLESKGRLNEMEEAAYSTRQRNDEGADRKDARKAHAPGLFSSLLHGLAGLIQKGNAVSVQVKKNGDVRLSLPLTVVVIALIFMFWWILIAAAIAMIFGYRYSIQGLSIDANVNSAMDKAGQFVDSVVKPAEVKIVVDDAQTENDGEDTDQE